MVHSIGILMISAAAGYWVLTLAAKEKGRVKMLGKVLGLVIILVSVLGSACKICYFMNCSRGMKGACPFTGKMMAPAMESK